MGLSVHDLITSPSADDIRRERASIAAWPSVSGDLQEVHVEKVKVGRESAHFEATVRYRYLVDGIVYPGNRLGVQDYREYTPEDLVSKLAIFLSPSNVNRLREATANIWDEPTIALELSTQQVTIYYDPANPSSSILDPKDHAPITSLDLIAPHLALIPMGSLMMFISFISWHRRSGVSVTQPQPKQDKTPSSDDASLNDRTCPGIFTLNDLRGEYWLYSEGELRVNVGCGGISGVAHFNTSDVHLESGGPLESGKVAEILLGLMIKFGSFSGGYKNLVLHRDGKYDLSEGQIAQIDKGLQKIGFPQGIHDGNESKWSRPKRRLW